MGRYKVGLLIGRFQPFHNGHLFLFKKTFKQVDKLIIGIGTPATKDEQNPYTFEQRKKMLEKVLQEEGWKKKVISILPITDYLEDDQLWLRKTLETVLKKGKFDIFIGNDDWTAGIFEKNYYKIWQTGFYKRYLFEGEKIRKLMREEKRWGNRVPEYLVRQISKIKYQISKSQVKNKKFNHIVFAGTFDHLHKGHRKLIDLTFKMGEKVSIGITTDPFTKGKFLNNAIQTFDERKNEVVNYLKNKKYYSRANLMAISDIYGPVLKDSSIDALVVSKETYPKALKINILRKEKNLRPLTIITTPFIYGDDKKVISSERIRMGEIDRKGHAYLKIFERAKKLILPKNLRESLRKPLGKMIEGVENELEETAKKTLQCFKTVEYTMVIAVGDIVTMSLIRIGFNPDIAIVDFRSRREDIRESTKIFSRLNSSLRSSGTKSQKNFVSPLINDPGTINIIAVKAIEKGLSLYLQTAKKQLIIIKGEEDLLTLPAILFAPLGSIVLYGQFDLGVVAVEVIEEKKKEVKIILSQFC